MVRVQSVTGGVLISPSAPSVRRWDRLWSSAVKGEVGVVLFTRASLPPLWIADQVRNDGQGVGRVICSMSSSSSHVCMLSFCMVYVRSIYVVDRRICGRAGFSYLYSFHCFHLAPLVSRHMGIVATESSEGHQIPTAALTPASGAPDTPCRGGHVRLEPPSAERACARHFFAFTCGPRRGLSHVALSADACLKRFADAPGVSGRRAGSGSFVFLSSSQSLSGCRRFFLSDFEWPFSAAAFFIHARRQAVNLADAICLYF